MLRDRIDKDDGTYKGKMGVGYKPKILGYKTDSGLAFKTPYNYLLKVDRYLIECQETGATPSKSGLARWMKVSTKTIDNYEKREGYDDVMEQFKNVCEHILVERLQSKDFATSGIIFTLKNKHGWTDKVETTNNNINDTKIEITWKFDNQPTMTEVPAIIHEVGTLPSINPHLTEQMKDIEKEKIKTEIETKTDFVLPGSPYIEE